MVAPAGVGRNPWRPLASRVAALLGEVGLTLRGQMIWDKGTCGNRTTWGSFRLPTDPSLRDTTETIVVAHKGSSHLAVPEGCLRRDASGPYSPFMPDADTFMALAQDHWQIPPESASAVGHPAPFPVALGGAADPLLRLPRCADPGSVRRLRHHGPGGAAPGLPGDPGGHRRELLRAGPAEVRT